MARHLSLTSIIAEATSDPLVVELAPGVEIKIMAPEAIGPERLDKLLALVAEAEPVINRPGVQDREVLRYANLILPRLMAPEDFETWTRLDPPMSAFYALLEAVGAFYAGAGTPGEGPGSPA